MEISFCNARCLREFRQVVGLNGIARFLLVEPKKLAYLLYRLPISQQYSTHRIKKRNGGSRTIDSPQGLRRIILDRLAGVLDYFYEPRKVVYGFVRGRGIIDNANQHLGKSVIARVDIDNFFPSITFPRIAGLYQSIFEFDEETARVLANLSTYRGRLPQGAPTSPVLSNIVCWKLDAELMGLAAAQRCTYTRYADDLIFSTSRKSFPRSVVSPDSTGGWVVGTQIQSIVENNGFAINSTKTSVMSSNSRQIVTGLIVNERVNVPRSWIRELRTMLFMWRQHGIESAARNYFQLIDRRNRRSARESKEDRLYREVIRGKLEFLSQVRGNDSLVENLKRVAMDLDPDYFRYDVDSFLLPSNGSPTVYVEGETDAYHLRCCQKWLARVDKRYRLSFHIEVKGNDDRLLKTLEYCREVDVGGNQVFLFDRDVLSNSSAKKLLGVEGELKCHRKGVYSLALPCPDYRGEVCGRICIEMLFPDNVIRQKDSNERTRLATICRERSLS